MSDTLGILYELRACYSRFDERQAPYYCALSEAIETMHNLSKQRKGGRMAEELPDSNVGNKGDTISRTDAQIELMEKCERVTLARESHGFGRVEWSDYVIKQSDAVDIIKNLRTAEPKWIPIKMKPMTGEDREYYSEVFDWHLSDEDAVMFDCPMPDDGQEVWICTKNGTVASDICCIDEGIGLESGWDWYDIVAWMPFHEPEPYKEQET